MQPGDKSLPSCPQQNVCGGGAHHCFEFMFTAWHGSVLTLQWISAEMEMNNVNYGSVLLSIGAESQEHQGMPETVARTELCICFFPWIHLCDKL